MHVLGKVLLFFVFVGGAAALYLTTQALDHRSQWMTRVQKLEGQYAENQIRLEKARADLQTVRADLQRVMLGWDRYWPRPPVTVVQGRLGQNALQVSVGASDGLQDGRVVHLFTLAADNSSTYLGAFKVAGLAANTADLVPNWRLRPGDIPALAPDTRYRVRMMVPPAHQTAFDQRELQLTVADELIAGNTRSLAQQTAQLQAVDEQLQERLKEINGNPDLAGKELPRESIEGLLKTIEEEEESRNGALKEGDRLRRDLKKATDEFNDVLKLNRLLANQLKQNSVAPVTTPANGP